MAPAPRLVLSADDEVAAAARAVVRFHLRALAREEAGARAGEIEPVHQLRVATRRLRAGLRLFAPVIPASGFTEWARRELAWLGGEIGAVRDQDVLAETVRARAKRLDADLRTALGPLGVAMHDERAAALAALVAVLDSPRCRRLLDRLATFAEAAPAARGLGRLGAAAPGLLKPLLAGVLRTGRGLDERAPAEALHRLRVRTKRLRYALETLAGLGGKGMRRTLRRLERLQELLGAHQDAATAIAWLRRYAETPGVATGTVLATGALIDRLGRRAGRLRGRFPRAWRRIDRRRLRARLARELARAARRPRRLVLVRAAS